MPDWTAFGAVAVTLTVLVLWLARATQSAIEPPQRPQTPQQPETIGTGKATDDHDEHRDHGGLSLERISAGVLLLNVAGTQLLFLALLLGGIWYAAVPLDTLGVTVPTPAELALGTALGVALFGLNQAASRLGRQFGLSGDEALREALAPERLRGWAALLFVVLPVVAGFEELLFRGALVGGLGAGFALPTALLVVASSAGFGLAHGAQGRIGVAVTTLLGTVLAVAFVVTGSLAVVVVAHYLINALEFVVYER